MAFYGVPFKNIVASTMIGTPCPAGEVQLAIGLQVTNSSSPEVALTVTGFIRRAAVDYNFAEDIPVQVGAAQPLIADKLTLEPGDQIGIVTSGAAGGVSGGLSLLQVPQA
jgi:hypothetical protein